MANDAWQECMTDEQMEDIICKYLSNIKKMMSLDIRKQKKKDLHFSPEKKKFRKKPGEYKSTGSATDTEYVELNYGKIVSK